MPYKNNSELAQLLQMSTAKCVAVRQVAAAVVNAAARLRLQHVPPGIA
jgi:hypothetical protein